MLFGIRGVKLKVKEDFTMNSTKERGLTPQEAADLIGCSTCTVKALARRGSIPFYRVGVRYLFTRSALLSWISDQEKANYKES
mgnify:CR=1 FL=1